jgi:hypothetical protein
MPMKEAYEVVSMDAVPEPPARRIRDSARVRIWQQLLKLPKDQKSALRVATKDSKDMQNTRAYFRRCAERRGLILCSSRNAEFTELYVWLVKKEDV